MKQRLCAIVFAGALVAAPVAFAAEADPAAFPRKPVRLIIGPAAGGPTDFVARALAQRLGEVWQQPVVVENRPGASNTIATALAAAATPDGHTLLVCPLSDAIAPSVLRLPYDFARDIVGVARIGTTANVLVVHPSVEAGSVGEFIAYAKANPGKLFYGAQGEAQAGFVSMELLKRMGGLGDRQLEYVRYRASSVLKIDLYAGRIHAQITNLPEHVETARTGKLRVLGVTTPKRDARLPEVPAIAESLPGFEVTTWYGVCGPSRIPADIVAKAASGVAAALRMPQLQSQLDRQGVDVGFWDAPTFTAFLKKETAKWAKVLKDAGIKPQ